MVAERRVHFLSHLRSILVSFDNYLTVITLEYGSMLSTG